MGIKKASTNAFEKIYDDNYRNINLNSLVTRYNRINLFGQNCISGKFDYQFYFKANNTPELIGNTSSVGHGLSLGLEYIRNVNDLVSVYISAFDRYIFRGRKKTTGPVYFGKDATFEQRKATYPIINEVNTITGKTGLLLHWNKIKRNIDIYCNILYGNIFGFVDSRDKRLRVSGGICIYKQDIPTQ